MSTTSPTAARGTRTSAVSTSGRGDEADSGEYLQRADCLDQASWQVLGPALAGRDEGGLVLGELHQTGASEYGSEQTGDDPQCGVHGR